MPDCFIPSKLIIMLNKLSPLGVSKSMLANGHNLLDYLCVLKVHIQFLNTYVDKNRKIQNIYLPSKYANATHLISVIVLFEYMLSELAITE